MTRAPARFGVGEVVHHRLFDYRGVVFDVDPEYCGSEPGYEEMDENRPPKDEPWYHVLPDGADHTTYVAERNLEEDHSGLPIEHPMLETLFDGHENGAYIQNHRTH